MKNIWFFPYHPDMDLLIEQRSRLKDVTILGISSYKEDAVLVDPLNNILGSSGNFEKGLAECDQLVLLENYRNCKTEKYYEMMEKAISAGIQVVLVPQLAKTLDLKSYQGQYTLLQKTHKVTLSEPGGWEVLEQRKYMIKTPVIVVFGMGKHCNKFQNQLFLKEILDGDGYHGVWISSNPLGALFGSYTLPEFLFDEHLAMAEKVLRMNEYLYSLELEKKPDVFLIGVPEGIAEFEKYEFHHFGEYALVIGSAVSVDSAVFCTYYLDAPIRKGIEQVAYHSKEKFGFPVDMVSVGRSHYEMIDGRIEMIYSFLSKEYAQKHYNPADDLGKFLAEVWNTEQLTAAMEKLVVGKLEENAEAI